MPKLSRSNQLSQEGGPWPLGVGEQDISSNPLIFTTFSTIETENFSFGEDSPLTFSYQKVSIFVGLEGQALREKALWNIDFDKEKTAERTFSLMNIIKCIQWFFLKFTYNDTNHNQVMFQEPK